MDIGFKTESIGKTPHFFWHIKDEIESKFSFIKGDFKEMEGIWIDFTDKVFERYTSHFLEQFVFATALKLSYQEFWILVDKAKRDCPDSHRYDYNETNIRDALILSVIRDIDGWYEQIATALSDSREYFPWKTINKKNICFTMELLFRVDKLLWDNLYHHGQTPPVDSLLYHNFLLDRSDLLYSKQYKEWNKNHDRSTIIEFQESVKKGLREARKKEIIAEYA